MDLKKVGVFLLIALSFISFLPSVFAQYNSYGGAYSTYFLRDGAERAVDLVIDVTGPLFDALIGNYTGGYDNFSAQEIFFVRILLLLIIFVFCNVILKTIPKIKDNSAAVFIIAASVSIISVRFMSATDLIFGVLLPYGVVGVSITTILPFVIWGYFLHMTNVGSLGRRMGWLLFAVVFGALWFTKSDQLSQTSSYIYWGIAIGIALAFFLDRELHRYFALHELNLFLGRANQRAVVALQAEYMNILHVDTPQAKARRQQIETDLRRLGGTTP